MENQNESVKYLIPISKLLHGAVFKQRNMILPNYIIRLFIIVFMAIVGYSLAKNIKYENLPGILLAISSLVAGIFFIYLWNKGIQYSESEKENF